MFNIFFISKKNVKNVKKKNNFFKKVLTVIVKEILSITTMPAKKIFFYFLNLLKKYLRHLLVADLLTANQR